jgi:hypothetical protein
MDLRGRILIKDKKGLAPETPVSSVSSYAGLFVD